MVSLKGAAVVVTGASSGIGLAVAERFVASGARVMTGSRSEPPDGLGRWVRTDVAALVLWLASEEASFVSGSLFTIDGGLTAQTPIPP